MEERRLKATMRGDGRYIAGYKFNKVDDNIEVIKLAANGIQPTSASERDPDYDIDLAVRMVQSKRRPNALKNSDTENEKAVEDVKEEIRKTKRNMILLMTIGGLIGFIFGAFVAVNRVLDFHGPTVTPLGTFIAFLLYLLSASIYGTVPIVILATIFSKQLKKQKEILKEFKNKF